MADVFEFSGILTSGFLDKTSSASGTSTTSDTGLTATTTQASELWIGCTYAYLSSSLSVAQSNPTNGFTLYKGTDNPNGAYHTSFGCEIKIVAATGTAQSKCTIANSCTWLGAIATFKGAP
jgi:hypothetical protein